MMGKAGPARMLSRQMLEGGRPGCVSMLHGMAWGANTALPTGGGSVGIYKGLVWDRIQLFVGICSLRNPAT